MAQEGQNDSSGNGPLPADAAAKEHTTTRRSVLKTVGIVAGAGLATGASRAASSSDYETITVDAGSTKSITVGSNETLENVLIDITAPGAFVRILPSGSNWTVRNVGVKGRVTGKEGVDSALVIPQVDAGSTGVMENIYIGDGTEGPNAINGMWVDAKDHEGTLVLRHFNVGHWCDNGIYGSGPGVHDDYGMGEVHIEESYAHNNNITGFRIGTPGSYVKDSVVDNTAGTAPPLPGGAVNDRGIWAKERSGLEAINCDIANPSGIAVQAGDAGEITLKECRTEGKVYEKDDGTINGTAGGEPDLSVPAGVPMTAEEAAAGTSSGGSGGSDGGSGSSSSDSQQFSNVLSIETYEGGPIVEYKATVGGSASKGPNAESNDSLTANDDGTTTIDGVTGNGYTDDFQFNGELIEFSANVSSDNYRVLLNGNEVTPNSDSGSDTSSEQVLTVETNQGGPIVEYELTIDGTASKGANAEGNDSITANDDGTTTINGVTGNGYTDNYTVSGDLVDVSANVSADDFNVLLDGQAVDLGSFLQSERTLTVQTNSGGPLVEYELTIDGTASKGAKAEGNDSISANGDGTTTIDGVTGNGYTDTYAITGELVGVSANVSGDHYRVFVDGTEVDLGAL